MAIQKIKNSLLYALSTDTKPANYANNTILYEQDTGNIYRCTSGTWNLFRGASKAETLSNKTISDTANTLTLTPNKYNFQTLPTALNAANTGFAVADGTALTLFGNLVRQANSGTFTLSSSLIASEGMYANYSTGTVTNTKCGAFTNATLFDTAMNSNPISFFRVRFPTVTNMRIYMGLKQDTVTTTNDTLVATTIPAAFLGFRTTDTNMQLVTCNGTTATYKDTGQAVIANQWHTWGLGLSSAGVATAYYDGAVLTTTSTTTPPSGQNMGVCLLITNSTSTAASVDIHYYTLVKDF